MDAYEALQLFNLSDGASVRELNDAYTQRVDELTQRIESAPTPVLKQKLEESLKELKVARNILYGCADEDPAGAQSAAPIEETQPAELEVAHAASAATGHATAEIEQAVAGTSESTVFASAESAMADEPLPTEVAQAAPPTEDRRDMTRSQIYDLPTVSMFQGAATANWTPPPVPGWTPPPAANWTPPPANRHISGFTPSMMADLPATNSILPPMPGVSPGLISMGLTPGEMVAGRYHVRGELGRGGMGIVYAAFDQLKQQEIALKVLLPHLLANDAARERFLNEAKIAVSLSHPFIIKVYDIQQADGRTFITMEKLEGQSLRHEIDDCKKGGYKIPVSIVLRMADELCDALQYAHQQTVHRDVKPENIWLRESGDCLLMDFGLARLISTSSMTLTNAAMGTPLYMAPEQRSDSKSVDGRADQYAVALVIYELLTGDVPQGNFQAPRDARKDVPAGMSTAIMRALSNSPEKRFPSMTAFKKALHQSGWGQHGTAEKVALTLGLLGLIGAVTYYFAIYQPEQAAYARMLASSPTSDPSASTDFANAPGAAPAAVTPGVPQGGGLYINTQPPKALVMLGGQAEQPSPASFQNLPAGTYHVKVTLHRYQDYESDIEVKAGQFNTQDVTLQPLPAFRMPPDPATYYQQILDQAGTADASTTAGQAEDAKKEWAQVIDCLNFLQETHPDWQPQLVKDRIAEYQHRLDLLQTP
jgi:serine/threonine protein kinase